MALKVRLIVQLQLTDNESSESECELFAFDSSDAFDIMTIVELERGHTVARGLRDWFVCRCVAFGLAAARLLWGRLSAAPSR